MESSAPCAGSPGDAPEYSAITCGSNRGIFGRAFRAPRAVPLAFGSLRRGDQFQKLLWIVQPIFELIVVLPEGGRGELRRETRFLQTRVGGYETHFVDADSLRARQRLLQLLREFRRLRFPGRECPRKPAEFLRSKRREELHAGEARGGKQLRKLFFRRRAFERNPVQEKLGTAGPEQQAVLAARGDSHAKLTPSGVKLLRCAHVLEAVKTRELQENVQTSNKRSPRGSLWVRFHLATCPEWSGTFLLVP